jgi:hypothetical protein
MEDALFISDDVFSRTRKGSTPVQICCGLELAEHLKTNRRKAQSSPGAFLVSDLLTQS